MGFWLCCNLGDPNSHGGCQDSLIHALSSCFSRRAAVYNNAEEASPTIIPRQNNNIVQDTPPSVSSVVAPNDINIPTGSTIGIAMISKERGELKTTSSQPESKGMAAADKCGASVKEEEECPTCLEEFTPENPMIVSQCNHHFHLGCIYAWQERSQTCPICDKAMIFQEFA